MDQWLRPCASTAGVLGSIPGRGNKILSGAVKKKKSKNLVGWRPGMLLGILQST